MTLMKSMAIAVLAGSVLVSPWSTPATGKLIAMPTTKPATQPSGSLADEDVIGMAGAPTTQKYPSPAELFKQLKAKKDEKASLLKVAYFDLKDPILESPPEFSWFTDSQGVMLHTLLERLQQAKEDKDVRAILINLTEPQLNLSQAQEVRDALADVRKGGKRIFVYADGYDTVSYTLASGASDICLLAGGEVMIPGVGLEAQFLKGLFDKIGVKADFVQIGQYKGAEEPYTRAEPSDELRGELNKLSDALYNQIVTGISTSRKLTQEQVKQLIDETMIRGEDAKQRGLIDHLTDQDGLRELIAKEIGGKIDLLKDYGAEPKAEVDTTNIFSLFAAMAKKPDVSEKPAIALIPAQGVIVDGQGEGSLFGGDGGVGSEKMRHTIRVALRDPKVKAVVIRIDSPGGSALASEVMWQSVRRLAKEKPVVISIGGMAASGGYYLASAGDTIFADPSAIVGSIGVVGGKFVLKDLFAKVGITSEAFMRGQNAGLFSSTEPWTDAQRKLITKWMQNTYDQFTQRIMTTREGKIKDIDKVARGRIFLAEEAHKLGMVDEIGGLKAALTFAAGKVNLKAGDYDIRVLPQPKSLGEILMGNDTEAATPLQPKITISHESILHTLPPAMRKAVMQQLQMVQLMQHRPVVLSMPFVLTVK